MPRCALLIVVRSNLNKNKKVVRLLKLIPRSVPELAIIAKVALTVAPKQAISHTTITDEEDCRQKYEATNCTGFAFQEESN